MEKAIVTGTKTRKRFVYVKNFWFLIVIATFVLPMLATAQITNKIEGSVSSEDGKVLNGITVSLLHAVDSSLVKIAVSDKNGNYEFENMDPGKYLISFTSVGFQKRVSGPFTLSTNGVVQIPSIQLITASTGMAGITIQARRPLVENKIDRMVVNVDASPTNAGSSALEVLEKSPGISVDRDGNISI